MSGLASGLIAALLPEAERRSFCARTGADALRGSYALAAAQVFVAGPWWLWSGVEYIRDVAQLATASVVQADGGESVHGLRFALVALGPLAYLVSVRGLTLGYVVATGLVRLIRAGVVSRPLGDPLLTLALWLWRGWRAESRQRALLARLGPERPDRVETRPGGLRVVTARARPDWSERASIEVGETFYRVRDVALRPDGAHQAYVYSLVPLEPGALIRQPVAYRPAQRTADAPPPPTRPAAEPTPSRRWTVDEGEEAHLTPEGPEAAVVLSRGLLPLRARSDGQAAGTELPGTALRLGREWFEVVTERFEAGAVRYGLEPWPSGHAMRETVRYGPALVRGAQRDRRLAAQRSARRGRAWPAYPLVGMLPETTQRLACDRLGLLPERATFSSALLELGLSVWLVAGDVRDPAVDPRGLSLYPMLGTALLLGPVAALALLRALGAVVLGTVSGSVLLSPILRLHWLLGATFERYDHSVVPLTRPAFWARLATLDHQRREPDGSVVVESLLAHLSWTRSARLQWQGAPWAVEVLSPRCEGGRVTYRYRLEPLAGDAPSLAPPRRNLYQQEVVQGVAQDWDDLLASGFASLVSMAPLAVQRRALESRGGPRVVRGAALGSALAFGAVGLWWASSGEILMLLVGGAMAADSLSRLLQIARGDYAPSLFGALFADLLRPERRPYLAHLAAEREALG